MIICHIVLPKNAHKKIQNNFGNKIFFGPLLLLNKFRVDLHREKGRMTNGGGKVFQRCFYHTYQVFCAVRARPPRPGTTAAATTAATATRAITGVVRNVHVGKCVCNGRPLLSTKIAFSINRFLKEIEKQSPSLLKQEQTLFNDLQRRIKKRK